MSQLYKQRIPEDAPFSAEQVASLNSVFGQLTPEQAAWLKGFLSGMGAGEASGAAAAQAPAVPLSILFGSESGNAEGLSERLAEEAAKQGFAAKIIDMADAKLADLAKMENVLVLVSTWGEGDPPSRAEDFYEAFMSDKAPKLDKTRYSVLGLGDTSYAHFNKMGEDFDKRFEALGAKRIYDLVKCDVDFEAPYARWSKGVLEKLKEVAAPSVTVSQQVVTSTTEKAATKAPMYDKSNPFPAKLLHKVNLNGTGSAKETIHAEISLEGSGLLYEAGDALGVMARNSPRLVEEFLKATGLDPRENVAYKEDLSIPFQEVLLSRLDLRTVNKILLEKYAKICDHPKLLDMVADREKVKAYSWGRDVVDLVKEYPSTLRAGDWVRLLRPLSGRLYSIASSIKAHPNEVHLTVAAVRYEAFGRVKHGLCSTFIADLWDVGETAPIYFHHNKNFKLPKDGDTPIIMVGPGTGIAPFRAFVEDRVADGAKGKNWLFFGDQHYNHDFLYQAEWQNYLKKGALHRLDVAFSRDQPHKIYVQDRMREQAKDIYAWLEEGAYFYVCGDASRMAKDVHQMLIDIIAQQGGKSEEDATAYVKKMQKERRYARDVY